MKRIMIVDDEKELCAELTDALGEEHHVTVAHNGLEAINKINEQLPDVLITDFKMPVMDGMELLDHVCMLPGSDTMRFILISGFMEKDILNNWKERIPHQCVTCLHKPVDLTSLSEVITALP